MHDGKKLPRWQPRLHQTMNMGPSSKHASTVPLVLNLDSGYINSQFNIVFDDWFATVVASLESLPDFNSPEWSKMFGDSTLTMTVMIPFLRRTGISQTLSTDPIKLSNAP
jgi:hypothetical protein